MIIPNWSAECSTAFEHKVFFTPNELYHARGELHKKSYKVFLDKKEYTSIADRIKLTKSAISMYTKVVDTLTILLTSSCPYKCVHCVVASPIAQKYNCGYTVTPEELTNTLNKLRSLTNDPLEIMYPKIELLGGEPLANPYVIDLLYITRSLFPKSIIHFYTSGFAFANISDDVINALIQNDIQVGVSFYHKDMTFYRVMLNANTKIQDYNVCSECIMHAPFYDERLGYAQVLNGGLGGEGTLFYCSSVQRTLTINAAKVINEIPLVYGENGDYWHVNDIESIDQLLYFFNKPYCPMSCRCSKTDFINWSSNDPKIEDYINM